MPHVVSIALTPCTVERRPADRYARVPVTGAMLTADRGLEGDVKSTGGKRQLNVMFAETVAELACEGLSTEPGELGEQLVIAGLDYRSLAPGVRIRVGDSAIIELGKLRTPCERFAHIQQTPVASVVGRIGYMARVIAGGEIEVGSLAVVESIVMPATT